MRRKRPQPEPETRSDIEPSEDEKRLEFVFRCLVRGYSQATILRIARTDPSSVLAGVGPVGISTLVRRVRESLRVEVEENRAYARAEQIGRLRNLLEKLNTPKFREVKRGSRVEQVEQPLQAHAIMRVEEQLARIEGNEAPIKVVDVGAQLKATTMAMIAALTPERFQELLNAGRERRRLAALAVSSQVVEVRQ